MNRMGLMKTKFKQSWLQLDTYYLAGKLNSFLAPHAGPREYENSELTAPNRPLLTKANSPKSGTKVEPLDASGKLTWIAISNMDENGLCIVDLPGFTYFFMMFPMLTYRRVYFFFWVLIYLPSGYLT